MNSQELNRMIIRLLWIAGLFVAVILVIAGIEQKEASPVEDVNIYVEPFEDGNLLINEDDINLTIERSFGFPLETLPLGAVDVNRLERVLEDDPFIRDANVFIDANNIVKIWVTQRRPLFRIIDTNGFNYYLDKDGFKMPLSKHFSAKVLVATGAVPPYIPNFKEKENHLLKSLFELANFIQVDDFMRAMVEQIYLDSNGEFTLVPKIGDQKIYLGRISQLEEKIKRLKQFYQEARPYEGWDRFQTIDLRYDGQVVCKKR